MKRARGAPGVTMIAVVAGVMMCLSCSRGEKRDRGARTVAANVDTTHRQRDTAESPGDILDDSVVRPSGRWITDANVLALLGVMNAKMIAAAEIELGGGRSDPVRGFAAMIAREHAELEHSVDSVSEHTGIVPVAPALGQTISAVFQAQVDSMTHRTTSLDRAFVREQVASHVLMLEYAQRLAAVADRPDVRSLAASVGGRLSAHLERARSLDAAFGAADSSALVDSSARRSVRRRP